MIEPDRARMIGTVLLSIAILVSAVAAGGLDTSVLAVLLAVLFGSVAAVLGWAQGHIPRRAATVAVVVAAVLIVFTVGQSVPLPRSLVSTLSPHAADVWSRCLHPLGEEGPAWITLSLDPTATRIEVSRGIAYLLALVAALRVARRREGALWLERALVVACVTIALLSAIHLSLGLDRLYGFYKPRTGVGTIAPLFNGNHLAGYLNIGLLICFSSIFSDRAIAPRAILGAVVVLLVAAELWIASRGGVAAMMLGMAIVVTWRLRGARDGRRDLVVPVLIGVAVTALFAAAAFPGTIPLLSDNDLSKLATPFHVFHRMVPRYLWFGVGRGAFESTYPEFRDGRGFLVWSHPENLLAQWVSEWGIVVPSVALLALGWALRPSVVRARTHPPVGPWVVLVALFVHNLVDFNSEVPAIGIAASVCVGIVLAGSAQHSYTRIEGWSRHPRRLALGLGAATLLALLLLGTRRGELLDDRESIQAAAQLNAMDRVAFRDAVRTASLAHPAEPYFSYAAAVRASGAKDESVVPWIDHTLERAPIYPLAHLVLARALRRRAPSQARLEYRIYAEQSDGPVLDIIEVAPLIHSYEDATEAAPSGADGDAFLDAVADRIQDRMPSTRARIDAELVDRRPTLLGPLRRFARDAYLDAQGAPWCEQREAQCIDEAIAYSIRVQRAAPASCDGYELQARSLALSGDARAGLDVMKSAQILVTDRVSCQKQLIHLADELDLPDEASGAIDVLSRLPCTTVTHCTENLVSAGDLEAQRGNPARAYLFVRRAHDVDPENDDVAVQAALRASSAGLHADAATIYLDLSRRHPNDRKFLSSATQEQAQIRMLSP